jgi:hypothetical protein
MMARPTDRACAPSGLSQQAVSGIAASPSRELRVLDVFSCIGFHGLGMARAGSFETVALCEANPRRRQELAGLHPGVPIHDDVRTMPAVPADVIFGGPPCQATSVGAAISGKRTGATLWPAMLSLGLRSGVEWFVVEQPPGNAAWEAEVANDLRCSSYHVADLSSALATLVRRIFAGECSWLPAPACRDWRSPGLRSHQRLTQPRGQQMPEVIGTRISSQLYEWMLGLQAMRAVNQFWHDHEAWGDFASLTSAAGKFGLVANKVRTALNKAGAL